MNFIQYFFVLIAVVMFIGGLFVTYGESIVPATLLQVFRYGRANKTSKTHIWTSIEIPKSWFAHFYLYAVILESIILYTVIKIYFSTNPGQAAAGSTIAQILSVVGGQHRSETVDVTTTILAAALFLIHLMRRLYECWFVHIFSGTKMNIFHFILAIFHYTLAELAMLNNSIGFTSTQQLTASTSPSWKLCYKDLNVWHLAAILMFTYGSYQQNKAHHQYRQLRLSNSNKTSTQTSEVNYAHRIPEGGLFEKISCPNYWAEIIIYASFCILFQLSNTTWTCVFLWVLSNQIISGVMNHLWYVKTFPDYPKDRKAVIPHVW